MTVPVVEKYMAQSLHIGLWGPFTNPPFGICATVPSILTLRYIFSDGFIARSQQKKPPGDSSCDLLKTETLCRSLDLLKRSLSQFQKGHNRRIASEFLFSWMCFSEDPNYQTCESTHQQSPRKITVRWATATFKTHLADMIHEILIGLWRVSYDGLWWLMMIPIELPGTPSVTSFLWLFELDDYKWFS